MASIIIATVPVHGHVTPLLAVARYLADRGDDVRFVTGARFAERVAATGATHVPLPAEADYDETVPDRFPERAGLKGPRAAAFDVEHVFARPSRVQYRAVLAEHGRRPADAVLVDPTFLGAAILGCRVGQPVTFRVPGGAERSCDILSVLYQPEAAGDLHL